MPSFFCRKRPISMKDFLNENHLVTDIAEGPVCTLRDKDTAESGLKIFMKGVNNIIIRDGRGIFQGILTNRDMLDFLGGGQKHKLFSSKGLRVSVRSLLTRHAKKEWQIHKDESVISAFVSFRRFGKDSHAITDNGEVYGMISERDFLKYINRRTGIAVRHVMTRKPFSIPEDTPVHEAAKLICRGAFRKLPVTKKGIVTGVVGPFDIISHTVRKKGIRNLPKDRTPVRKVMNSWVTSLRGDCDIHEAARIMKNKKIGFLPVTYDGELEGILTVRDIIDNM